MPNTIQHKFRSEILIPFAALDDNITFLFSKKGEYITSDGVSVTTSLLGTLHALSTDASDKIDALYGMGVMQYLSFWYSRCGWSFDSLELLHIKLIKK